MECSVARCVK